jgi:hypothetical protein
MDDHVGLDLEDVPGECEPVEVQQLELGIERHTWRFVVHSEDLDIPSSGKRPDQLATRPTRGTGDEDPLHLPEGRRNSVGKLRAGEPDGNTG